MAWIAYNLVVTADNIIEIQPNCLNLMSSSLTSLINSAKADVEEYILKPLVFNRFDQESENLTSDIPDCYPSGSYDHILDAIMTQAYPVIRKLVACRTMYNYYLAIDDEEGMAKWDTRFNSIPRDVIGLYVDVQGDNTIDDDVDSGIHPPTDFYEQLRNRIR